MKKFLGVVIIIISFTTIGCTDVNSGNSEPVMITLITMDETSISLKPGNSQKLVATIIPNDASNKNLNWSSGNESIATVSSDGTVTVKSDAVPGTFTEITANAKDGSNKNASCTVTVADPGNSGGEDNPETNIGMSSAIGNRLYVSDFPVFDYDTDKVVPFEFDGKIDLLSNGWTCFLDDWENPADPLEIPAFVVNNKLSFDTGEIPNELLLPLGDGLYSTPPNVKGRIVQSFSYSEWEEGEDEFGHHFIETTVNYEFSMLNKNNLNESIGFIFVDKDAVISGIDWQYWELTLKKGWNSVKFDNDRLTTVSFVPDENYIWVNNGLSNADEGGMIGMPLLVDNENTVKISGTISVSIDGSFPAGGIILEAFFGESLGVFDISSATNPTLWEFSGFPPISYGHVGFYLKIFPSSDRKTFYTYRPSVQSNGNTIDTGGDDPKFKIENVVLQNISVNTITVPISIIGINNEVTLYSDRYSYSLLNPNNNISKFGMTILTNGSYDFIMPDTLGLNNDTNENWLWFKITADLDKEYISKGRYKAGSSISLNIAEMYQLKK